MGEKVDQSAIVEADGSAVVPARHRMSYSIGLVSVEKMDSRRIGYRVPPASPFYEESGPRKHQNLARRFFFLSESSVRGTAAPVGHRYQRTAKKGAAMKMLRHED